LSDELAKALARSTHNEAWVAAITAWFEAHELHFGHGTENAGDEAWWLLRHLQSWDDAAWAAPARPELAAAAVRLAEARVTTRKPLAYLINEAWFCGEIFYVDDSVLVPRSPIAEIIEQHFAPWITLRPGDRLLDIGTGSGCIAIAAALHCHELHVDATDTSAAALEVARRNVALHGLESRVRTFQADLYPGEDAQYRVIISNPPYVPEAQYAQLPAEYLQEPREGLVGGPTGLEPAWSILRQAADRLTQDGIVVLEVGAQAELLAESLPGLELIWLDFERGGEGVCVVLAEQLRQFLKTSQLPTHTSPSE
jgi:ribosomal protein L3 glutamine methyltransferase